MRKKRSILLGTTLMATMAAASGQAAWAQSPPSPSSAPIDHVIVIYQENHSFDNLYGSFPGADGLANAGQAATQLDANGQPFDTLPSVPNSNLYDPDPGSSCLTRATPASADGPQPPSPSQTLPAVVSTGLKALPPDQRFPDNLPNKPFDISSFVAPEDKTGDLVHRFYQEQMQIDGGKMDKFAAISDARGLSMGYYDGSKFPLWNYAQQFTLADHFFHAAFGGSFLNHFFLVAAAPPSFLNAPADIMAQVDANGNLVKDGAVTPDHFAVNTLYSVNTPHPCNAKTEQLVPEQTMPHIGDRLDAKGLSWAWYSGGWNDAVAGNPDPLFQFHHQPFAFFQDLADGTPGKAAHLKDETDFFGALRDGSLPNVSFIKPMGPDNEHPGYADVYQGEQHVVSILKAVQDSQLWNNSAVIITYDENGGFWDHVAPPKVDRWGPGVRVPTLIVSPYAKHGFVDHTTYDTTSILRFIEWRWGLDPLTDRDAKVNNLLNAFDFSQKPS